MSFDAPRVEYDKKKKSDGNGEDEDADVVVVGSMEELM